MKWTREALGGNSETTHNHKVGMVLHLEAADIFSPLIFSDWFFTSFTFV